MNDEWIWIGGAGGDGYGMELSADKAYNQPHNAVTDLMPPMSKDINDRRIPMKQDEFDAIYWRKVVSYGRSGIKKIKRGYQRRMRHVLKVRLHSGVDANIE